MSPFDRPPSRKVLVLGKDTRSFLSVVRSLGRQGLEVHVGWCDPRAAAARSRYVRTIHEIPPFSPHEFGWRDRLLDLLGREGFDLVVPCNDPSLLPLQLHKKDFDAFLPSIYLLNDAAFRVAFDKLESYELAKSLGICVPPRVRVACLEEATSALSSLALPVVIKPKASFTPDRLGSKHHVRWARSPRELEREVHALLRWGDVAVEERCPGRGVGVEVLAHQGQVLVSFQHVRLHEPPTGGGSSYRRSTELHPELLEATTKFLEALRYTGVAMMEFKVDPESGKWAFIEINGRFWGSLPLALAAGVDFPYYLYQMWVEGRRDFPRGYRTGVHCRHLIHDFGWMKKNWQAKKNDPTFATVPWWRMAIELLPLVTLREHSDTFVLDDPRPGFVEFSDLVRRVVPALDRAVTALLFSRPQLWRHRMKKARQALQRARRILFVCKGNICRSPFAHGLAETMLRGDVHITSGGYHQEPGRPCPVEAIQVAEEMGIDLRPHRSRVLSPNMLEEADVVFVFDEDNYVTLRQRHGWAMPKVHFLGVLGDRPTAIIRDPYGGTRTEFRVAYEAIQQSVMSALRSLPRGADTGAQPPSLSTAGPKSSAAVDRQYPTRAN